MQHAGSAIAQGPNVGRIDRWSLWRPTGSVQPKWLLMSGATNPPTEIGISKRRTRDDAGDKSGKFLAGVGYDLVHMEHAVGATLFNTVKDLYLTKSRALEHIETFFKECKEKDAYPMLYYTGHGEIGTGNWCFHDGKIGIKEIVDMVPEECYYPMIFSDACFSGNWADFCLRIGIPGFHCLAACPYYSTAVDTKGEGGDLTLFMTGKKERPSTEPMYSGGNVQDFPITSGYDYVVYADFIGYFINNNETILISQSMHNGCFSGIFAASKLYKPRPAVTCGILRNFNSFINLWQSTMSQNIYSIACDEKFGFGVFLMEGFGTSQAIVKDAANMKKKMDDGFMCTACAARGSTFYIVMTKGTKEYQGKAQTPYISNTWNEMEIAIRKESQNGKAITGICYSTGMKQYFVVMTETSAEVEYSWHDRNKEEFKALQKWMKEKKEKGFYPTIVFHDPTDDQILIVMTTDKSSPGYKCQLRFKMK